MRYSLPHLRSRITAGQDYALWVRIALRLIHLHVDNPIRLLGTKVFEWQQSTSSKTLIDDWVVQKGDALQFEISCSVVGAC